MNKERVESYKSKMESISEKHYNINNTFMSEIVDTGIVVFLVGCLIKSVFYVLPLILLILFKYDIEKSKSTRAYNKYMSFKVLDDSSENLEVGGLLDAVNLNEYSYYYDHLNKGKTIFKIILLMLVITACIKG